MRSCLSSKGQTKVELMTHGDVSNHAVTRTFLLRVDVLRRTHSAMCAICGMKHCAIRYPRGFTGVMDRYASKTKWLGTIRRCCVPVTPVTSGATSFWNLPALLLWRQKAWWHRDERQAKRGRNGAENWKEIKWIDKDGASEGREKKIGKWIDCDWRERGGVRRVMPLIHRDRRGRCTPFFPPSKCYRKTYIT